MSQYFFKKIRETQWLGLCLPDNLQMETDEVGQLLPMATPSYGESSLPTWGDATRVLVLGEDGPMLVPALDTAAGWTPFQRSIATLEALPAEKKSPKLIDAMKQAINNPLLPLRLYQAYRDFSAQGRTVNYASDDDVLLALILAVGGNESHQPIEAYSELLFIVDSKNGPPALAKNIDAGDEKPARLRVTALQSVSGVTLQFESDQQLVTNGKVVSMIQSQGGGVLSNFAPFYRWRRTLGVGERPSGESGTILIPTQVTPIVARALDSADWAARPLRITDRLGAQQLAGELLNYDVKLFNPHGRCTHLGRVLLKRQRLDPPLPPLRGNVQLLPPVDGSEQARCIVTFAFAVDQPDPLELQVVVYRQDYPVVPTGFYGDDDDLALTVARSLGDLDADLFGGQLTADVNDEDEAPPNLSSHNLSNLCMPKVTEETLDPDGQVLRRFEFTLTLESGRATRLFLALRRNVEVGDAIPESPVTALQHLTGPDIAALRSVPHFERFWGALPKPTWLGEGAARVREDETGPDGPHVPAKVHIEVQHATADAADNGALIGGYRLWMRDVVTPDEETPFHAVALVQAVPELIKVYAPIEFGRNWSVINEEVAPGEANTQPKEPQSDEFILLSEPAPASTEKIGDEKEKAGKETDAEKLQKAIEALRKLSEVKDASHALDTLQKLQSLGLAREYLISIEKRRAMMRNFEQPAGYWVFFYDQQDNLMGRAIQFWLPSGHGIDPTKLPYSRYRLKEKPCAQDTVALNEFGRMTWTWEGIGDFWRHELEWVIEAVPRYAPIQGQRKSLGLEKEKEITSVRRNGRGQWHRLVVLRRAPFTARFGLAQVLDAVDDAFVIVLDAPQEFRQSLYNSVARTRQGVPRMHAGRAELTFRYADQYLDVPQALMASWLVSDQTGTAPRPPAVTTATTSRVVGAYGELVYDEPPCVALKVGVGASADDRHGPEPVFIGPLTRRRMHTLATPPQLEVLDNPPNMQIDIPMARLGWFYSGLSQPLIKQFPTSIDPPLVTSLGDQPLLRLPDPDAELLLYFRFDGNPLRLVAHFRGSAFKKGQDGLPVKWVTPSEFTADEAPHLLWGEMRVLSNLDVSISQAGDLRVAMNSEFGLPKQVVAQWRCEGLAVTPISWEKH